MAILAALIAAVAAFFGGIAISSTLYDHRKDRWTPATLDRLSMATFVLILNLPAYTAAFLGAFPLWIGAIIHCGLIALYAFCVLCKIQNYTESFVLYLMFSFVIAMTTNTLRHAMQHNPPQPVSQVVRSPNMVFTQGRGFVLGESFGLYDSFVPLSRFDLPRRLFGNVNSFW